MKQVIALLSLGIVLDGVAMEQTNVEGVNDPITPSQTPISAQDSDAANVQPNQMADPSAHLIDVRTRVMMAKDIMNIARSASIDPIEGLHIIKELTQAIQMHRAAGDIDSPAVKDQILELQWRLLKDAVNKAKLNKEEEEQN